MSSHTEIKEHSTTEPLVPTPNHNPKSEHRPGWLLSKRGACKQSLLSALGLHSEDLQSSISCFVGSSNFLSLSIRTLEPVSYHVFDTKKSLTINFCVIRYMVIPSIYQRGKSLWLRSISDLIYFHRNFQKYILMLNTTKQWFKTLIQFLSWFNPTAPNKFSMFQKLSNAARAEKIFTLTYPFNLSIRITFAKGKNTE